MLSIVVLMVILLIVYQISYTAKTDARVSRNEEALMMMDLSIESVLLQVFEDLKADAEGGAGGADPFAGASSGGAGDLFGSGGGEGEGGGEEEGPTDSMEDEWRRPQRTELNELRLRILVQDEDSKFNVLSILTEDEDEANKAFDRLVRIIDFARGGTEEDIEESDARRMAEQMLEFLNRRLDQKIPKPSLLSDNPDNEDWGIPLDLREFVVLEDFEEKFFRDYRDEDDVVVHSLGSFLTVWSSLGTADMELGAGQGGGGQGSADGATGSTGGTTSTAGAGDTNIQDFGSDPRGGSQGQIGEGEAARSDVQGAGGTGGAPGTSTAGSTTDATKINVNTAPAAVLKALFDDRDVPLAFWDEVLEYRNEEDEEASEAMAENDEEPPLDEFGEPIIQKQIFKSTNDLETLDGWITLDPAMQSEILERLKVTSDVFSVYITARKPTSVNGDEDMMGDRDALEREETEGTGLMRTVRSVVWRQGGDAGTNLVPLIRWEVLDYVPYEVKDFDDEDQ